MKKRVANWLAAIRADTAGRRLTLSPEGPLPQFATGRVHVRDIARLLRLAGAESVFVSRIAGFRRRQEKSTLEAWYCVRARVAIQVEGQVKGMQSVEERFVLVRASSFAEAERRLAAAWRQYAEPYMNGAGRLVRWQLETVEDVYLVGDEDPTTIDGEVYSRIRERRMTKKQAWLPKW